MPLQGNIERSNKPKYACVKRSYRSVLITTEPNPLFNAVAGSNKRIIQTQGKCTF